jgi:hypothetical protein
MRIGSLHLVVFFLLAIGGYAQADLEDLAPEIRRTSLARAEELYAKRDIHGLLALLRESHLFIKQDVALKLGRLGAREALEDLRTLDKQYSEFACAESGEFGVAVILIEKPDSANQKAALLTVATESRQGGTHSLSVVDKAGMELSRFDGDDILQALVAVNTYGAQYTVLALQCRKLPAAEAIAKCIGVLETHATPQKAEAAQSLLVSFGKPSTVAVLELKARVEKNIKKTDPTFTIPKTIVHRCERILRQIGDSESANKVSEPSVAPAPQVQH